MGKRARGTAREARGPVSGNSVRDIFAPDEAGKTGGSENSGSIAEAAGSDTIIDPAAVGRTDIGSEGSADSAAGENRTKRKYTRRTAKPSADAVSLDIGSFKDILFSTHAMIASMFNAPNFALDDDEAEKLSKAIANVTRHYDIPGMSQKSVDWIMAIQASGAIYGPRLLAWRIARMQSIKPVVPPNPNAPQNVGVAASAPGAKPSGRAPMPMPSPLDPVRQPVPVTPAPNGPVRQQPGLDKVDGADMPLKFNYN
jgi:hypothetical protein